MVTLTAVDKPLTVSDVAELLQVSPNTIRRWTDRGILPAVRLPTGGRRYRRAAVEHFMREHALGKEGAA